MWPEEKNLGPLCFWELLWIELCSPKDAKVLIDPEMSLQLSTGEFHGIFLKEVSFKNAF